MTRKFMGAHIATSVLACSAGNFGNLDQAILKMRAEDCAETLMAQARLVLVGVARADRQ